MSIDTRALVDAVASILLGKEEQVQLALCCFLARGHLLIEDVPGVGKTTLAQALVRATGLEYQRIQFTSDLLPSDVLGVSVFDRREGGFQFHPGPIFTSVLLVDEINRASPKTQSALLEAMAEGQVTVEGETRPLPQPFFVIATQNPVHQSGTFSLPESQLDRFLMRISLGYPDERSERALLMGQNPHALLESMQAVASADQLRVWQQQVESVSVSDAVVSYIQRLVNFSREDSHFALGLSTRASLALIRCAKAWALLSGRDYLLPDDVQQVLGPVAGHRVQAVSQGAEPGDVLVRRLLSQVPVMA